MSCEKKIHPISHPTKLVGQQVCSSIYEQSSCNRSRISINVQTLSSKPIFSHKKKIMSDRRFINQVLIPLLKKTFNKKLSSSFFYQQKKKVQTQKSTGHPTFFLGGVHSRRLTNQRPNTRFPTCHRCAARWALVVFANSCSFERKTKATASEDSAAFRGVFPTSPALTENGFGKKPLREIAGKLDPGFLGLLVVFFLGGGKHPPKKT